MFYERMRSESSRLTSQIKELQSKLKQFPDGKIFCTKNRQYFKCYVTDGKTQTYLPKNQRPLAEELAAKKIFITSSGRFTSRFAILKQGNYSIGSTSDWLMNQNIAEKSHPNWIFTFLTALFPQLI